MLVAIDALPASADARSGMLADLAGRPALALTLARLEPLTSVADAELVVITSDRVVDDPIADLAEALGVRVVRGRADDRLHAHSVAMVRLGAPVVVRVPGSGPFADPYVVVAALERHRASEADHTSNLLPRTYPRGLDVEVMSARALGTSELEATEPVDRDGFGTFARRRPERFRLAGLASGHDLAGERWCVDASEDLDRARAIASQVPDLLTASWNRVLAIGGRSAKPTPGQVVLRPDPAPEPGSAPWTCRYSVIVDADVVGSVEVHAHGGRSGRTFLVDERWLEPARQALYQLLAADGVLPDPTDREVEG